MPRVVKYKTHYKTMQKMKKYRRDRDSWIEDYEKLYKLACDILMLVPEKNKNRYGYAIQLSLFAIYRTDDYMKMITHPDFVTGELIDEKIIEYKVPKTLDKPRTVYVSPKLAKKVRQGKSIKLTKKDFRICKK